uniref:Uncharacterized protein n=1 Tax=Tetraselmis sp. GSL018 TaxID=582737 RepID=A0A061SK61_9CHLO
MKRGTSGAAKDDRIKVSHVDSLLFGGRRVRDQDFASTGLETGGASVLETGQLVGSRSDKLAMFEAEDFSVDFFTRAHLGPLSEKGIARDAALRPP